MSSASGDRRHIAKLEVAANRAAHIVGGEREIAEYAVEIISVFVLTGYSPTVQILCQPRAEACDRGIAEMLGCKGFVLARAKMR